METADSTVAISDPGEVGRAEHTKGDRAIVHIANVFSWLYPILIVAICSQVVLRYIGFNQAWLDDLQWWLYGIAVLVGIGYAVTTNSHVRVDIFYDNYPRKKQLKIEIFALAWLFLPFIILCWDLTVHYAIQSVGAWEGSSSPNGLHNLWFLKVLMNVSFIYIAAATWFVYLRRLDQLEEAPAPLWKKLALAFPAVSFAMNLAVFYVAWWIVRLTSPADMSDRDVGRHWFFDEFDIGPEEMKITVATSLTLTVILIGALWLLARNRRSEA